MKLYSSIGPNPHVVRMFIAEKGLQIPVQSVDLRGGENRREPYVSTVNSRGQLPALELDDGTVLCEITAICEYLDEKHPNPPLIGSTAEERAETRMWTRRVDLYFNEPMATAFRASEGRPMFESRMRLVSAEAAVDLKAIAQDALTWLDGEIAGKTWLCGTRFTMADILLYGFVSFGAMVRQPLSPEHKHLQAWFERVQARESAKA
ncbi:MAG: glutathione S-transferase family protein [Burkholderiaceae bacterium]